MKKIFWVTLVLLTFSFSLTPVSAQEILLENETEGLYDVPKTGKNRRFYNHFYGSYGAFIQTETTEGLKTNPWLSYQFTIGSRQKFKLSGFYAMGLDFAISWNRYRIVQDENNVFPDALNHKKEVFGQNGLSVEYFNRFNFDYKRGDHIGKYLDLGVWGSWVFMSKQVVWDEYDGLVAGASRSKTIYRGLDYDKPFQWGLKARLGFDKLVFFAAYRMSSLFTDRFDNELISLDPGRLVIGIEGSAF